jgi:hypothetical protein
MFPQCFMDLCYCNLSVLITQNTAFGCSIDPVPLASYLNNIYAKFSLNLTFQCPTLFLNFYFLHKIFHAFLVCHIPAIYPDHSPINFKTIKILVIYWTPKYLIMQLHIFMVNFITFSQYISAITSFIFCPFLK